MILEAVNASGGKRKEISIVEKVACRQEFNVIKSGIQMRETYSGCIYSRATETMKLISSRVARDWDLGREKKLGQAKRKLHI